MNSSAYNAVVVYEGHADSYDQAVEDSRGRSSIIYDMSKQFLDRVPGNKLLDIGCGTGLTSSYFACGGFQVCGLDAAISMLKIFQQKRIFSSGLLADAETVNLPFKDESFDVVISNGLFCLFEDLERVISEAGRVLKKGGMFCFTVEDVEWYWPQNYRRSNMWIHRHNLEEMANYLFDSGFRGLARKNQIYYFDQARRSDVIFTVMLCWKN